MGWTNSHLHEFDIGGLSYGPMDAEARAMGYPAFDEKRVRLSDFKRRPGITFTYIYDLGDNWEHDVEIEDFVAVVNEDVPKVHASVHRRMSAPSTATWISLRRSSIGLMKSIKPC